MSLNKWILGKEKDVIILEKIYNAVKIAFLTKKGIELKYEKRFCIEDLITIISKKRSLKEDIVRKYIEILIEEDFIFMKEKCEIYCDHEFSENIRALVGISTSKRGYIAYKIGRKNEKRD